MFFGFGVGVSRMGHAHVLASLQMALQCAPPTEVFDKAKVLRAIARVHISTEDWAEGRAALKDARS